MSVQHFTIQDSATWYQADNRQIFLADVVNSLNSNTMSVGFARYDKGESNEWIVYRQFAFRRKATGTRLAHL